MQCTPKAIVHKTRKTFELQSALKLIDSLWNIDVNSMEGVFVKGLERNSGKHLSILEEGETGFTREIIF